MQRQRWPLLERRTDPKRGGGGLSSWFAQDDVQQTLHATRVQVIKFGAEGFDTPSGFSSQDWVCEDVIFV